MAEGKIFKWGSAFPQLEALGRAGAGQSLAPSGEPRVPLMTVRRCQRY